MSSRVFVGNLNFETTRDQLSDLLSEAGEIKDIYLPVDRATGRPRGFAFVEFSSDDEAEAAIEQFNDHELAGRKLRVNAAEDRPRRPSAPSFSPGPSFRPDPGGRPSKPKGSRRRIRARKRSL